MKYDAKVFTPKYVDNEIDLKCAINTREVVIVSSDKALFVELEAKFKKKKASTKTKKAGSFLSKVGMGLFAISLFIPGLNGVVLMGELAVAGIGGLSRLAGSAIDDFKNYTMVIDYENKRVLFVRVKGNPCFNEKADRIVGIDLQEIIRRNNQ
jgi:hypothetical protein